MDMDDKMKNNCRAENEKCKRNFQFGKTYYIDRSGMAINEEELYCLKDECSIKVESCCRLQIPRGFNIADYDPSMCFNLSNLCCVKNPIIKKVELPSCQHKHPTECEIVSGYEIKAVGEVEFSVSVPICPIKGYCFTKHSNACCNTIVPVNKIISYSCNPKPCPKGEECVDWKYAYLNIQIKKDGCGQYLQVNMGIALEYNGSCECDEE